MRPVQWVSLPSPGSRPAHITPPASVCEGINNSVKKTTTLSSCDLIGLFPSYTARMGAQGLVFIFIFLIHFLLFDLIYFFPLPFSLLTSPSHKV